MNLKQTFIFGFVIACLILASLFHLYKLLNQIDQSTDISNLNKQIREIDHVINKILEQLQNLQKPNTKSKQITVVSIVTPQTQHHIRSLIGSIHRFEPHLQVVLYGIDLTLSQIQEIYLWKSVQLFNIKNLFPLITNVTNDTKFWKPIAIYHSILKFKKILYLENNLVLNGPLKNIINQLDNNSEYNIESIMYNSSILGLVYGSYTHELIKWVKCTIKGDCITELISDQSSNFKQLPPELRLQTPFDNRTQCFIRMRTDFIVSFKQLPRQNLHEIKKNDTKIRIAIGFPVTSKGTENPGVKTLPMFRELLPSLLFTIKRNDTQFEYKLYIAYDQGDPYFDNETNIKTVQETIKNMTNGYPVTLEMIRCAYSNGWTTFLWNTLFQYAIVTNISVQLLKFSRKMGLIIFIK